MSTFETPTITRREWLFLECQPRSCLTKQERYLVAYARIVDEPVVTVVDEKARAAE